MTPSPKSTIRDGKWVVVQMIRTRDGKAGWRETEVKDERK